MSGRSNDNHEMWNKKNEPVGIKGYYGKGFRNVWPVWVWSAFLALLCSHITYPGIWYSDSYVRVTTGGAVLNAMVKALSGNRIILETGNAFTVIPSFVMAVFIGLTGHVALYSFFQAFAFFFAMGLLIRELKPAWPRFQYVAFCLSPVIYGVSVYYEANIGSLIGMIVLILLFRKVQIPKPRMERVAEFLMISFATFITVGYRTNALTVLPVLLVYLYRNRALRRKILPVLALAVGLILVWLVPWCFGVIGESNMNTGFVWEMITTIQRMDPADRAAYLDYLDDIGGDGATEAAVQSSNENTVDGFMWGSALNTTKLSAPGVTWKVMRKYIGLIRERFSDWFRMKWDFLMRAMGISQPLDLNEYDYNRWERMDEYGFNDSLQRQWFHSSFIRMNEILGDYTRRPWVPFLISAFLVLVEWIRRNRQREMYLLLFLLALFYYGAYLVVIVVFELRMFYPALFLLKILDADIVMKWIHAGLVSFRKKVGGRPRARLRD